MSQGGLSINDERLTASDAAVPAPIDGRYLVLRAGKRSVRIGRLRG
jgi:tyrosyl-tRNA synthetase